KSQPPLLGRSCNSYHRFPGGDATAAIYIHFNYCKLLNFREYLIFANHPRLAKNRSREQFGRYVNTTEATFDSRKLEPANNFNFSALPRAHEN
ncbi:MAG: hypothetical protein PV344_07905, partial [Anaplasma sp.]|nr:hypothetical protein [Anaplasma sp.]